MPIEIDEIGTRYIEERKVAAKGLKVGTVIMYDADDWVDDETMPGWYSMLGQCVPVADDCYMPDMTNRFVRGGLVADVGLEGGYDAITLGICHLPTHMHTGNAHNPARCAHTHCYQHRHCNFGPSALAKTCAEGTHSSTTSQSVGGTITNFGWNFGYGLCSGIYWPVACSCLHCHMVGGCTAAASTAVTGGQCTSGSVACASCFVVCGGGALIEDYTSFYSIILVKRMT
jgi:hypothetical protein